MVSRGMIGSVCKGFFFFLFFRIGYLLLSLPAWALLILHFTVGISIWWFAGYIILWFVVALLRYLLIVFARQCVKDEKETLARQENKNPYSHKNTPPDAGGQKTV